MKFFWKIYFSFTVLFLASFGVFGSWMIQMSFSRSLNNALEEGERDNRMYQLAFEMNLNSMDDIFQTESAIPVTVGSVVQNLADTDSIYRVYGTMHNSLYESKPSGLQGNVLRMLTEEQPSGYEILREGSEVWLLYTCRSDLNESVYYLENLKNISGIYEAREQYYDGYTIMMAVLTVVITVLVYVITRLLTRPIGELARITRGFANGDYEARASENGGDEIAELAMDFNHMADTILDKLDELTMQARRQEDFTASFAHELKTPLTSIIGYADMLRTVECTDEERQEAADHIFWQGKRLESLSFKLLELIVTGNQEHTFCELPVEELAGEAANLTRVKRQEKKIQLLIHLERGTVFGERDLLISVLTNLLDNSRKATEENGLIGLRGKTCRDGGYLLAVLDNGCGMEAEEIDRIVEAFYMVDKSRARKEGGAGLGMTLVNRILELHHANWKIFSAPQGGTTVVMKFPGKEGQGRDPEMCKEFE